jgi:ribosomal protein S6--L-glutamate ligase
MHHGARMKLTILSRAPKCYSTRRLVEAAKSKGHDVLVRDPLRFAIDIDQGDPDLFYKGKSISVPDAVLPRIGTSVTRYGTTVLRQFEHAEHLCRNR